MNPTHSKQSSNYFAALTCLEENDDDKTIVMSNLSLDKYESDKVTAGIVGNDAQAFKMHETDPNPQKYAIFDSGATAHFLVKGASVVNERVATNPLHVKLPDGT